MYYSVLPQHGGPELFGNLNKSSRHRKDWETLDCAYNSFHISMVWILHINMGVVCAPMTHIRHRYILRTHHLLSQFAWSLYQGKSNHECSKSMMTIWQEDTVTDSHLQCCHVAPRLQRSQLRFQRRPDAGVVKIPPTPHRFTCWPSNQIQLRCGPHLRPALSALDHLITPFLSQPP